VAVTCLLLVLAEGAFLYDCWTKGRAQAAAVVQLQHERATLQAHIPSPTAEVARAIEGDLAKAQTILSTMQADLFERGVAKERLTDNSSPIGRTEAYFDLASYVENLRAMAAREQVVVSPAA